MRYIPEAFAWSKFEYPLLDRTTYWSYFNTLDGEIENFIMRTRGETHDTLGIKK
jgi:hypothetical protein